MPPTKQPVWKFIANLGDKNPLEHGGYFVYRDETGVYQEEADLLIPPEKEGGKYRIYRILLDRLKLVRGYLVPFKYGADWSHPVAFYDDWVHAHLDSVAKFVGVSVKKLAKAFTSRDPLIRAEAYRAVADYTGYENFDERPIILTRGEVEERYDEELH
jgi:hypothetical protein